MKFTTNERQNQNVQCSAFEGFLPWLQGSYDHLGLTFIHQLTNLMAVSLSLRNFPVLCHPSIAENNSEGRDLFGGTSQTFVEIFMMLKVGRNVWQTSKPSTAHAFWIEI